MNINGLLDCLQLYTDRQELRELGLSEEEIEGFIEFDWEPVEETWTTRGDNDQN